MFKAQLRGAILAIPVAILLASTASSENYVVRCDEPIPEFTLGEHSSPTDEQASALCACMWDKFGGWERKVSTAISEGRQPTEPYANPELNVRAFMPRFQNAVFSCGGDKL